MSFVAGAMVLAALGYNNGSGAGANDSGCRPTYIEVNEKPLTIQARFGTWTVQAILIGCRKDLDSISDEEKRKIVNVFYALFAETDLHLLLRIRTSEFREELVKRINDTVLLRRVVSAIAFLQASRAEVVGELERTNAATPRQPGRPIQVRDMGDLAN